MGTRKKDFEFRVHWNSSPQIFSDHLLPGAAEDSRMMRIETKVDAQGEAHDFAPCRNWMKLVFFTFKLDFRMHLRSCTWTFLTFGGSIGEQGHGRSRNPPFYGYVMSMSMAIYGTCCHVLTAGYPAPTFSNHVPTPCVQGQGLAGCLLKCQGRVRSS